KSLREFWGRRYNRLAGTVFRECVFQPINSCLSSPLIAAISTFVVSGLLHFKDKKSKENRDHDSVLTKPCIHNEAESDVTSSPSEYRDVINVLPDYSIMTGQYKASIHSKLVAPEVDKSDLDYLHKLMIHKDDI
ncbi:unnamed protein product, partial [Rotaria sp. Silwood1]